MWGFSHWHKTAISPPQQNALAVAFKLHGTLQAPCLIDATAPERSRYRCRSDRLRLREPMIVVCFSGVTIRVSQLGVGMAALRSTSSCTSDYSLWDPQKPRVLVTSLPSRMFGSSSSPHICLLHRYRYAQQGSNLVCVTPGASLSTNLSGTNVGDMHNAFLGANPL